MSESYHKLSGSATRSVDGFKWFPISAELMFRTPEFAELPVSYKLYYWQLVSEGNVMLPFKRTCKEQAEVLSVNESTIRRARERLKKLGWIEYRHGTFVSVTQPGIESIQKPKEGGGSFARINREVFNLLLDAVKLGYIKHEDVVVYVYVLCWALTKLWAKPKEMSSKFPIERIELETGTGVKDAVESLRRIESLRFFDDTPPFRIVDLDSLPCVFIVDLQTHAREYVRRERPERKKKDSKPKGKRPYNAYEDGLSEEFKEQMRQSIEKQLAEQEAREASEKERSRTKRERPHNAHSGLSDADKAYIEESLARQFAEEEAREAANRNAEAH